MQRFTRKERWDKRRRRIVARCFDWLFSNVDRQLCKPAQLPATGIHRVLVCRPNHRLGNAILVTPLLAEIEALYPGCEIDLVTGGSVTRNLVTHRFQVRHIFSLPRKMARHPWLTIKTILRMRSHVYDLAIDAGSNSQSGRLLLGMAKARFKLGFQETVEENGSPLRDLQCPEHFGQRAVYLLRLAYAGVAHRAYPAPNVRLSAMEKQQAKKMLAAVVNTATYAGNGPVIGIFTNATGTKRYDSDWWLAFVDTLQTLHPGLRIVDVIAEHGQTQLDNSYASYYTSDLRRLASVIAEMDGFISADCGVMHLAVASGTPTLGLFSVTGPGRYGPYGSGNASIETSTMPVSQVASVAADWLRSAGQFHPAAADVQAGSMENVGVQP